MLIGSLAFGAFQVVAGLMPGYVPFILVLVPMGMAFMTYVTTLNATFQLSVDPRMRGRVMSMFLLVFMGVAPIGAPVVGLLADTFGPETSLVIGGAVTLVVVTVISVLLFRAKGVRLRDVLPGRRPSADAEAAGPESARTGDERGEAPEAEHERVDVERRPDGSTGIRLVPDENGSRPDTVTRA